MKRLILCVMVVFSITMMAQEVKTHTIQRGETIESIAAKYQVSVGAIKKANPYAGEVYYVGMKLNIPAATVTQTAPSAVSKTVSEPHNQRPPVMQAVSTPSPSTTTDNVSVAGSTSSSNAIDMNPIQDNVNTIQNTSVESNMSEDDILWSKYRNFAAVIFQFNPVYFTPTSGQSKSRIAFSLGYRGHARMFASVPFFYTMEAAVQYTFDSDKSSERVNGETVSKEITFNMWSGKVNSCIGYGLKIPNLDILIIPEAGIDFRCNLYGKSKTEIKYGTQTTNSKINLFDENDMGKDGVWKSFNLGWHVGLSFRILDTLIGFSYQRDFTEIYKNCYMDQFNITAGFCL